MIKHHLFTAVAATLALSAAGAMAVAVSPLAPTKANGSFIAGSGIPSDSFTVATAGTGEQVALKARDRNSGNAISQVGNRYVVPSGLYGNRAAWNFDFQFSPGSGSTALSTDYTYELKADLNPAFGVSNFVTINVPPTLQLAPAGDSYFANPGPGAWSDDSVPFVIANSENYTFSFLAGPGFTNQPFAEYELVFTAYDSNNNVVATTNIYAEVVPEPTSLAVLSLGGLTLLRRRR